MNRLVSRAAIVCLAIAVAAAARPAAGEEIAANRLAALRKALKAPSPAVRLRAALALGEADDAEAIPVLIELLGELPREQRQPVEEFLTRLAGEWAPLVRYPTEDEIGRRIRRDAWMAWWRNSDGDALLALFRKHVPNDRDRDKVRRLLVELSDRKYSVREMASEELLALGRVALPQLRQRVKDGDEEVSRRLRVLTERIEREPSYRPPDVAIRLLAVRKPAGAAEALLAYLPFVEEETQTSEVRRSLAALALLPDRRDAGPTSTLNPSLVRALRDSQASIRATAAEALVRGGGSAGRAAVRKLLAEDVPIVRARVALALAMARQRDGVPALIDLLGVLPSEQVGEVEDVLYQLAGETAPETVQGSQPADRKKSRDAWSAWWQTHGGNVDLTRLTTRPSLGFTIICEPGRNRVYEVDRHNKVRWSVDSVECPVDAWVVGGNHVLIAESVGKAVSERDFTGKIVWRKALGSNAMSVQRLANGDVFVATTNQLLEIDRAGKERYTVNHLPAEIWDAYRSRTGPIVCLLMTGQCLIVDTTGKQLRTFAAKEAGHSGSLDVLANDRILVAQPARNKVVEFNSDGKKLLELAAPGVDTATGLANGHVLVASQSQHRIYELNRGGKIVWERTNTGTAFRARRR